MGNVIYGQYDLHRYPLKRFYYEQLPKKINDVLLQLNQAKLAIFRGGLAFVFILNEKQYLLKDLDMFGFENKKESILNVLVNADIIFINKNTFGSSVITAFWKSEIEYYKLDILLCSDIPSTCEREVNGKNVTIVSASYIWKNRIEKIAEKNIRNHDDMKTLNHYRVANSLSKYLLNHKDEISAVDIEMVNSKLSDMKEVLSAIIHKNDLEKFLQLQIELTRS